MSRVKGSKHFAMKVVPHRPWRNSLLRISGVLLVGLLVVGAYQLGRGQLLGTGNNPVSLAGDLANSRATEQQLRQELARISVGAEVDRKASEEVRQQVAHFKAELQQQQEQIRFYRSLMAPGEGKEGIALADLDYSQSDKPATYRFRLKVLQLSGGEDPTEFEGEWQLTLVGKQGEHWRSYTLKELSPKFDSQASKLKFKYFQSLSGEIRLPAGFIPEYTDVEAKASGRSSGVNKRFKWAGQSWVASKTSEN
jgi:hypothetical protein